ncbi:hypothetical protein [Ureibacillus aquaedulcis]|uniref:Uncharacterized protein n=1 Tax=Ureibacillus aquaedulcis TaxID=3058421 RepID=A0ABT8GQ74_9BACL|nr:hypothetical protein [Ureibacillus sp. BA0131]MDN4493572.1 hypothetical protein [Ureibacillus sp. BA0131]
MATVAKFISLAALLFSIVAGLLLYYWMMPASKEEKKKQMEEVFNFFINFVMFMWVGKVILNFSVFIKDPLAVLAYPANSASFYLAIIGSILLLILKRKKVKLSAFISILLPVVLMASVIFEFIQFLQDRNFYTLMNLIFYMILVAIFYYFNEHVSELSLFFALLLSWLIGTLLMYYSQPYVSFFGYLLSLPFILLFFLFNAGVLIYMKFKR